MNAEIKKILAEKLALEFEPDRKEGYAEEFLSLDDQWASRLILEQYGLPTPPVAVLRKWGIKVAVRHYRQVHGLGLQRVKSLRENNIPGNDWKARGGMTEAEITLPQGQKFYGKVRCAKVDNYHKRTGTYLALLKAMDPAPVED